MLCGVGRYLPTATAWPTQFNGPFETPSTIGDQPPGVAHLFLKQTETLSVGIDQTEENSTVTPVPQPLRLPPEGRSFSVPTITTHPKFKFSQLSGQQWTQCQGIQDWNPAGGTASPMPLRSQSSPPAKAIMNMRHTWVGWEQEEAIIVKSDLTLPVNSLIPHPTWKACDLRGRISNRCWIFPPQRFLLTLIHSPPPPRSTTTASPDYF